MEGLEGFAHLLSSAKSAKKAGDFVGVKDSLTLAKSKKKELKKKSASLKIQFGSAKAAVSHVKAYGRRKVSDELLQAAHMSQAMDVAFVIDATYSMHHLINGVKDEIREVGKDIYVGCMGKNLGLIFTVPRNGRGEGRHGGGFISLVHGTMQEHV
jgi:hypothetical protein